MPSKPARASLPPELQGSAGSAAATKPKRVRPSRAKAATWAAAATVAATAMAPAKPAPLAKSLIPACVKIHATQLFPHLAENVHPETGEPLPPRIRAGGQFSCRRLCIVNKFNPKKTEYRVLPMHVEQNSWPIRRQSERLSDPATFKEDEEPGNIELIFDFEDHMIEYMKANRLEPFDPLRKNDLASDKFPEGLKLSGPMPPPLA